MTNLDQLRYRIKQKLVDPSNAIWTDEVLDEAIRETLSEYRSTRPRKVITTVTFASSTRELDISSITDLLEVRMVWLPYTAADPEDPPNRRAFEHWRDSQIVYFPDGTKPDTDDVARIFYLAKHRVKGLDGETSTSYLTEHESMLITGFCGYAATSRAVDLLEQTTLYKESATNIRAWGQQQLMDFRRKLGLVQRQLGLTGSAFVKQPDLDRYDGDWS